MKKRLLVEVVSFGVIGVTSLLIDMTVTVLLYNVFLLPAFLASGLGFCSAFFFNFPMNRKKVFHHSERDRYTLRTQVISYFSLSLFNLVMTSLMTELLVNSGIVKISYAKLVVTAIIAVWNFLLFKFVIFSKRSELPNPVDA